MPDSRGLGRRRWALACGGLLASLALTNLPAMGQTHHHIPDCKPWVAVPVAPDCWRPAVPGVPAPTAPPPIISPTVPGVPPGTATPIPPATAPQPPAPPGAAAPVAPQQQEQAQPPAAPAAAPDAGFAGAGERAVGGEYFTGAGYIDSAIPVSQFRLRYDAAYGNNRPDRAEFFYPKCGCFKMVGLDANAAGPPLFPESNIDYQDVRGYLEFAPTPQFSAFVDIPFRMINPDLNANANGLGDIQFGGKFAFIYTPDAVVTAQVLANAPTGDPFLGLGTNNWAIEPGVLAFLRVADNIFIEAEVRDYIPLNSQTDFAGNVLRYGLGASYLLYNTSEFRIAPVVEFVGWTVLDGKEFTGEIRDGAPFVLDSSGTTIVNAKLGLRIGFGQADDSPVLNKADLYIGYGRALTGAVWYEDVIRAEFRYRF